MIQTNKKLKVLDLFAGAGGFGLGFGLADANYEVICSLEMDKWAADTLKENNHHLIINDSITNYDTKDKIFKSLPDRPDIIIGGPPCQGFSLAGRRNKEDSRNKLYLQYFNWVKILMPKVFIIENVSGILTFKTENGEKVIDEIRDKFKGIGYEVNIWKVNASEYGIPQNRNRVFVIGHIGGIHIPKPAITHSMTDGSLLRPITVGEAILDLPTIVSSGGADIADYDKVADNQYQIWCRSNSEKVFNHEAMKHTPRMISRYEKIIGGEKLNSLTDDLKVRKRNGQGVLSDVNYSLNYRHLKSDVPAFTIPAHFYSSFIHPLIPRNITTREAARLQSFPDSYKFMGKRTMISSSLLKKLGKEELNHLSQYNQVGNAVPPLLAFKIAEHIKKYI